MKLYEYYKLDCNDDLKAYCLTLLTEKGWNFNSSIIIRLGLDAPIIKILNDEMQEKGLPAIRSVSIFCRGPNNIQPPHRDTRDDFAICRTGFYIPLLYENSKIYWFNPLTGVEKQIKIEAKYNSDNKPSASLNVEYENKDSHVIGETSGPDPLIINTSVPHSAVSTTHPKATIAIRLIGDIDLFEHFKL